MRAARCPRIRLAAVTTWDPAPFRDTVQQVLDAFLDGLEQARAAGHVLAPIASVASFFVSRVDAAIDARLDALGTPEAAALRGKAAIANARLAYGVYQEVVASQRWKDLAAAGDSCIEPDRRFHLLIAEATGNLYFSETMAQLGSGLIPRNRMAADERSGAKLARHAYLANLEHEAILNAIRRQDPDAARAAICLHLSNSRDRLLPE